MSRADTLRRAATDFLAGPSLEEIISRRAEENRRRGRPAIQGFWRLPAVETGLRDFTDGQAFPPEAADEAKE